MISAFGYGIITKAIVKNYKVGKWNIYDDSFKEISSDEFGNKLLPSSCFDANKSELELVSPGIPPYNELVKQAKHLISELDFYYEAMPMAIYVSGTNGKTTTTEMISHLLNIECGGNIGVPIANMNLNSKLIVLEISSFMLHYTKIARPEIYALLPIEDDHISWHGSFSEYEKAKLDIIFRMNKTASAIVPKKYEDYLQNSVCKKYYYENSEELASLFNIDINKINFKEPFLLDAIISLAVSKIASGVVDYELINNFKIDPHKKEEFYDKKNRLWVDDSKATNISAALAAIKSYKGKTLHLIAGGDEKGQDLKEFFKHLPNDTKLYLIGKKDFSSLAKECGFEPIRSNLKDSVEMIYKTMKSDEIAILSPACASLDEFSSYKQRGELFKKYVMDNDV